RRRLARLLDPGVGPAERRAQPAVGPAVPLLPAGDVVEEVARRITDPVHLLDRLVQVMVDEQPLLRPLVVEAGERVFELAARDVEPEMLSGDGFERMRLVEDG